MVTPVRSFNENYNLANKNIIVWAVRRNSRDMTIKVSFVEILERLDISMVFARSVLISD